MATEDQKKQNMVRLLNLTLYGVAAGIWDFVGESALALSPKIGEEILKMMEKETGLEIAGEKTDDVLSEIARLFVDEYGFAGNIDIAREGDIVRLKVKNCLNHEISKKIRQAGVEKQFTCPIMNASIAAMKRLNVKARSKVDDWAEENGSIISLEIIE